MEQQHFEDASAAAAMPVPEEAAAVEATFGGGIIAGTDAEVGLLADPSTLPRSISASAPRTQFVADKEALGAMSDEERVERIRESVERTPTQREILYQILLYFQETHSYEEGEDYVAAHKAYKPRMQSPRILIDILVRAGGIDVEELDSDGQVITEEMKDELRALEAPEDEIEDLIVDWRLTTSQAGEAFLAQYTPASRLQKLIDRVPAQAWIYTDLLAFCKEKRTLGAINDHLPLQKMPHMDDDESSPRIQPSVFVSRLDEADGLTWEEGWLTTKEGEEFLATHA